MFGLRKRAKLIQEDKSQSTLIDFNNLPVEVYYCIFDFLKLSDILNLRLLNSFFKHLIDNSSFIWKKNVIKIQFNSKVEMEKMANFIKQKRIQNLKASCLATLTKKQLRLQKHLRFDSNVCYHLDLVNLNIFSINCLNFFTKCSCVRIRSFINTSSSVISPKFQDYSSVELEPLVNTRSFDVSCLVFDEKSQKKFFWDRILSENCLLNKINRLFPILEDLTIHYYNGCVYKLFKKISKLEKLKLLELNCCKQEEITFFKKLEKVKNHLNLTQIKLILCSWPVILTSLKITDKNVCRKLVLILQNDTLGRNEMESEYVGKIVQILPDFLNLIDFETNLYHLENAFNLNRYVVAKEFFQNLKYMSLVDDGNSKQCFNIENFSQIFLNNKYSFNNLRSVRIKIVTQCSMNYVLKNLFDYFVKNAPCLATIEFQLKCINLNCSNKKICSFLTKGFDRFVNDYFCFRINVKFDEIKIKNLLNYYILNLLNLFNRTIINLTYLKKTIMIVNSLYLIFFWQQIF